LENTENGPCDVSSLESLTKRGAVVPERSGGRWQDARYLNKLRRVLSQDRPGRRQPRDVYGPEDGPSL